MASKHPNYAAGLLQFLPPPPDLPSEPSDQPRRGAPKKLRGQRFGQFLRAIAEINSSNKNFVTDLSIAAKLRDMSEYKDLSERQLRRDVKTAIDFMGKIFEEMPRLKRRAKVFELLREEFHRHNN